MKKFSFFILILSYCATAFTTPKTELEAEQNASTNKKLSKRLSPEFKKIYQSNRNVSPRDQPDSGFRENLFAAIHEKYRKMYDHLKSLKTGKCNL